MPHLHQKCYVTAVGSQAQVRDWGMVGAQGAEGRGGVEKEKGVGGLPSENMSEAGDWGCCGAPGVEMSSGATYCSGGACSRPASPLSE